MIALDYIRRNTAHVQHSLQQRGGEIDLDRLLLLDQQRRELISRMEKMRARRKMIARLIGNDSSKPEDLLSETRQLSKDIKAHEGLNRKLSLEIDDLLLWIPNLVGEEVPEGLTSQGNITLRQWGAIPNFTFEPRPHWELAEKWGIIDFDRGSKLSGSRFFVLRGRGAQLQRALIAWMMDHHTREHAYTEVYLPYLVRRDILEGSGNLPKFSDNLYRDSEDDLWLIPTAEAPLTNLHRDEILDARTLPLSYVAHTPCFRREKAAAGKDTRGIKRVHQFDKVELYKLVTPETSNDELQYLLADAEEICRLLEIPHRTVELCAGELAFPATKSYDLEMWAPGSNEWLEVSSCSNCTDFQSRRANIRYRATPGSRPDYPHTLNGSALALPRVIIAILENGQDAEGNIHVPRILWPYTGFKSIGQDQ